MRFGSRRSRADHEAVGAEVTSPSGTMPGSQPPRPSQRLGRVAEHFHLQAELLSDMGGQFEAEIAPLHELLVRQHEAMQRVLENLEQRLRPLNEYADGEERNLDSLRQRIEEDGADHVARSFKPYLDDQRRRIAETRAQIAEQRVPFVQYGSDQSEVVEVALSHLDPDLQRLQENLAEQRRVMLRMLEAMRSESFCSVKDYLLERVEALSTLADEGITDPAQIGGRLGAARTTLAATAGEATDVRAVLERADQADQELTRAAVPHEPVAAATLDTTDDEPEEDASAADLGEEALSA
jgi:hypothetical protein